mmetsp:Transcript_2570/g.9148  ORF Transcript_2570/g.9148 Transcript_2570/m.9148 type:complete len:406 (-) Transcript_2570:89-1306(-)
MSLGLLELQKTCKRTDGCLRVDLVKANNICPKARSGIYCIVAVTVPYSLDQKARRADKGKRLAERKHVEHFTKTRVIEESTVAPAWNESYEFYLQNLGTINFFHVEVWAKKKMSKDRFLGSLEVPISNSFIGTHPREDYYPLGGVDGAKGDVLLRLHLVPPATGIEKISLQKEDFPQIPAFIFDSFWVPRYLRELVLQDCGIEAVDENISNLSLLAVLNLRQNKIKSLPSSIGRLTGMQKFDMANNQLTEIPAEFANLQQLSYVDLIGNQIAAYPWPLCMLPDDCVVRITHNNRILAPSEDQLAAAREAKANAPPPVIKSPRRSGKGMSVPTAKALLLAAKDERPSADAEEAAQKGDCEAAVPSSPSAAVSVPGAEMATKSDTLGVTEFYNPHSPVPTVLHIPTE